MRLIKLGSLMLMFATIALAGCATTRESGGRNKASAEAALRQADVDWSKSAAASGLDGFMTYYTPDAKLLAPNAPLASGTEAIRALLAPLFAAPGFSLSWQPVHVEVARSGELGYVHGTYQLSLKDASGAPHNDRGKYLEVWKKQPNGEWKCIIDTFMTDLPLQGH